MTYRYVCGFCLSVTGDILPPEKPKFCPKCHVTQCVECRTFLKGDAPKLCHGCGKVAPRTRPPMTPSHATATLFDHERWMKRNLGAECKGVFRIWEGQTQERKPRATLWLESPNGEKRELTAEEKHVLGFAP